LFRPLPYPRPERLVLVWEGRPDRGWTRFGVSAPAFRDWRDEVRALERVVAFHEAGANVAGDGGAHRVEVVSATVDLLPVLGLRPALGRGFEPADEAPGTDAVLLTDGFWRSAFGADPRVVGRELRLGRERLTVVGVLPPAVGAPFATTALFRPLALAADLNRGARWLTVLARLAPGHTFVQARAELRALAGRRAAEFPETNAGWTVEVAGLADVAAEGSRRTLLLLSATVGLVLLLACANVAHLLLVRVLALERECAVRAALGAGAWALAEPILLEGLVLGCLGGGAGLVFALAGHGALRAALPASPALGAASLDARALGFALGASLLTGLLVTLLPVLHLRRARPYEALRSGGTTVVTPGRRRVRRGLVVAELAIAFVLLSGAGLLVRTVRQLLDVDPGFRAGGALAFRVAPPQVSPGPGQSEESFFAALLADRDRAADFYARLLERLRALPGVEGAAAVNRLPLTGGWWVVGYEVAGGPPSGPADDRTAFARVATPGYFAVMGIPLRSGRDFDARDGKQTLPVVILDEALARREFGDASPLGATLLVDGRTRARVVGVAGAVRSGGLDQAPAPTFYVPLAQAELGFYPDWGMDVVVRTKADPGPLGPLAPLVRGEVRALDPGLAVFATRTLGELLADSLGARRVALRLLGAFSLVALALAALGLYGVLAQLARERTREFGVRLALGGRARHVAALVLRDGLSLTALGALAGAAGAIGAGRALAGLLHGARPGDPATLLGVTLLLALVAAGAALPSAARAARLDPAVVLRDE
ncbi:MAG TPA: ADOP family duplicated permease, partial [Vicinamibacteria bacterium]|nr:ADOP family duplicated permease [Vicinamibacteria bacterium]